MIQIAKLVSKDRYEFIPYWLGTKAGIFFDLDTLEEFSDWNTARNVLNTRNSVLKEVAHGREGEE